jgi:hypothetical protein
MPRIVISACSLKVALKAGKFNKSYATVGFTWELSGNVKEAVL